MVASHRIQWRQSSFRAHYYCLADTELVRIMAIYLFGETLCIQLSLLRVVHYPIRYSRKLPKNVHSVHALFRPEFELIKDCRQAIGMVSDQLLHPAKQFFELNSVGLPLG